MEEEKKKRRLLILRIASIFIEVMLVILDVIAAILNAINAFIAITILAILGGLFHVIIIVLEHNENKAAKRENENAAPKPVLTKQELFSDVTYVSFKQGLTLYDKKDYINAICKFEETLSFHRQKNRIKSLFVIDYITPAIHYNLAESYNDAAKGLTNPVLKNEYYNKAESNYLLAKKGFWPIENEDVKIGKSIDIICSGICVAISEFYKLQGHKEKYIKYEDLAIQALEHRAGRYTNALISSAQNAVTHEDYRRGLEQWKKILRLYNIIDEPDLIATRKQFLDAYLGLANCHYRLGEYREACSTYEWKALIVCEQYYGTEHHMTSIICNLIGMMYDNLGEYTKALKWYQKALAISEKVLGKEHSNTASIYNNIATVVAEKGDYGKALEWYQKSLAISEKMLGKEHPDLANIYNSIASALNEKGDYSKALEWCQKALDVSEMEIGEEHNIAITYNNTASVYYNKGDYSKALEWYQEALNIFEKVLGKEHPETAHTYHNIARAYDKQRAYFKALEWYQKSFKILDKRLGSEHPKTLSVKSRIEALTKKI